MLKITASPNCSNSPKMELIKNLTIHFVTYDLDKAMPFLVEDFAWTLVGDCTIYGKAQFRSALEEMSTNKATELSITSVLTHGQEGAVHGEILMEDGHKFGFADFYKFSSVKGDKVKSIVSYVVELKN